MSSDYTLHELAVLVTYLEAHWERPVKCGEAADMINHVVNGHSGEVTAAKFGLRRPESR